MCKSSKGFVFSCLSFLLRGVWTRAKPVTNRQCTLYKPRNNISSGRLRRGSELKMASEPMSTIYDWPGLTLSKRWSMFSAKSLLFSCFTVIPPLFEHKSTPQTCDRCPSAAFENRLVFVKVYTGKQDLTMGLIFHPLIVEAFQARCVIQINFVWKCAAPDTK